MKTQLMEIIDTTVFKSFAHWTDLQNMTTGHELYIELSNGYFAPIQKSQLKKVADSMTKNDDKFCGMITFLSGRKIVQVSLK